MQNQRDKQIYALYGQAQYSGPLTAPFFPSGVMLAKAANGREVQTTGPNPTNATTLAAGSAIGAPTISTVATYSVNDIIQIDSTASLKSEVRKVTAVSGA